MIALVVLLAICAVYVNAACDAPSITKCADSFTQCVKDAGTDTGKLCNCYAPYYKCLSGCPQATIDAIINACKANSNCTAAQCAAGSASTVSMSLVAVVAALVARFY